MTNTPVAAISDDATPVDRIAERLEVPLLDLAAACGVTHSAIYQARAGRIRLPARLLDFLAQRGEDIAQLEAEQDAFMRSVRDRIVRSMPEQGEAL